MFLVLVVEAPGRESADFQESTCSWSEVALGMWGSKQDLIRGTLKGIPACGN
jgi:hypothetical protein